MPAEVIAWPAVSPSGPQTLSHQCSPCSSSGNTPLPPLALLEMGVIRGPGNTDILQQGGTGRCGRQAEGTQAAGKADLAVVSAS